MRSRSWIVRSWIACRWAVLPVMTALLLMLSWPSGGEAEEGDRGWLGVSLQQLTPSLREAMDISSDAGVLITEVLEDSPAGEAGLKMGDVIVTYDGQTVSSPHRLSNLVRGTEPETEIAIAVLRKGQEKTFRVKIGELEGEQECMIKIFKDGEKKDIFLDKDGCMDIDEDALLLGLPPLPELWSTHGLWLGVKPVGLTEQLAEYFRVKDGRGVLIGEVMPDSPAEKAGLQAGDIIVRLDDERVEDTVELRVSIEEHEEGDEVAVVVVRDGKEKTFRATLEESPENGSLALTRKLEKWPDMMKKIRITCPSQDMPDKGMMDLYIEKGLDEGELEEMEERLKMMEEELQRLKKELDKK